MPGKVVAASAVLALAGWIAGTKTEIVSDFHELLPASLPELQDVGALEEETGSSGEVSVAITADDLTDPAVIAWMKDYRQRVLDAGGYEATAMRTRHGFARRSPCPICSATRCPPTASESRASCRSCPLTSRRP